MMELKTFKDFEDDISGGELSRGYYKAKDEIREEVIKWIKWLSSEDYDFDVVSDPMEAVEWMKHFFNIADEEA